jgi:UDP-glucose 4-epimerase
MASSATAPKTDGSAWMADETAPKRRSWLVTGGCGFIGSHLVDALVARGDRVRVLDDLSTGRIENLSDKALLIRGDVVDRSLVCEGMNGVDGCFHLAAVASVERGNRDWIGTHRSNLTGTIVVFDAARNGMRAIPVVYASSAAVYGGAAMPRLSETMPPQPCSAYGADKLGCELHARVARIVHGVPTVGLRFFNVFGPRQDPSSPYSGVISIFCHHLRTRRGITIHGDGGQTRDFVYVGDVVRALLLAMERMPSEAPVLNVCSGRGTSILELAIRIAAQCGVPVDVTHQPARPGDIRASVGDPTLAEHRIGFLARTSLDDGLHSTLDPPAFLQQARPSTPIVTETQPQDPIGPVPV